MTGPWKTHDPVRWWLLAGSDHPAPNEIFRLVKRVYKAWQWAEPAEMRRLAEFAKRSWSAREDFHLVFVLDRKALRSTFVNEMRKQGHPLWKS